MSWLRHRTTEKKIGESVPAIATTTAGSKSRAPNRYISALAEATSFDSEFFARAIALNGNTWGPRAIVLGLSAIGSAPLASDFEELSARATIAEQRTYK